MAIEHFEFQSYGVDASIEGYTSSVDDINWQNYLKTVQAPQLITQLKTQFKMANIQTIAIVKSLYVEEDVRNQGEGSLLLETVINDVYADVFLLEVDTLENNTFNLQLWYESFGFTLVGHTKNNYPIMQYVPET